MNLQQIQTHDEENKTRPLSVHTLQPINIEKSEKEENLSKKTNQLNENSVEISQENGFQNNGFLDIAYSQPG